MSEDYGTCVVLTLEPNNIPDYLDGEQHVTLAYFGNNPLSATDRAEVERVCKAVSETYTGTRKAQTRGVEQFDGSAVVVLLDQSHDNPAVVIRSLFLNALSDKIHKVFMENQTYPIYKPHITMGYSDQRNIYVPTDIQAEVSFEAIEVWNAGEKIKFPFSNTIRHIGVERRSGRYPWGSGENPYQRNRSFLGMVDDLHKKGMTEAQIAEALGMTSRELRARKSIAKNEQRKADITQALTLKSRGYSNVAIAEKMGIGESQVRRLIDPAMQDKTDKLTRTQDELKAAVDVKGYLDFGEGTENHLGVSKEHLETAVKALQEQGYTVHYVKVQQLGTGEMTTMKVLAPPDTATSDVYSNMDKIQPIMSYQDVDGVNHLGLKPINSVDSSRLMINYTETGGSNKDGVIELRRGVDDISLGESAYAQVRIGVDGTHYLKGMAVYADDLPPGVDIRFNTNKSSTGNKLDALKTMSDDPDNPFGSTVRQKEFVDAAGKTKTSALNIVNEEGTWDSWSKTLSSQFLSKQSPALVKQQLDEAYKLKKAEFDEINSLTNPVVRKELLMSFADDCDASAVHLKAHMLPRQRNQVILPVTSMKDTEVYAPNFKNGERVVLIRHPHGGVFEIPELTVNNKNPEARKLLGAQPKDAIGIHPKVAERLSGADFDGDTVIVIPNNRGQVKTAPALTQLKDFDPKRLYPGYEGMPKMRDKQGEMGRVSNLITDMTIKGAPLHEIARAVKHSMVVIDAEKHNLDYKRSAKDNGIADLKQKYQGSTTGGAATLISRAKSVKVVDEQELRKARDGGPIDKTTGEKVYVPTGRTYTVKTKDGGVRTVASQSRTTKMEDTKDARTLSSGTRVEETYASHANGLKAMANQARLTSIKTATPTRSPSAAKAYAKEVSSLNAKLNVALKNKPLERMAQVVGNAVVKQKKQANPNMEKAELKKVKNQALNAARNRVGASKQLITFSDREWEAIQAGAVSPTLLSKILKNSDRDMVKQLAMPKTVQGLAPAKVARAKAMAANGHSQADIAAVLGVSPSTISEVIK